MEPMNSLLPLCCPVTLFSAVAYTHLPQSLHWIFRWSHANSLVVLLFQKCHVRVAFLFNYLVAILNALVTFPYDCLRYGDDMVCSNITSRQTPGTDSKGKPIGVYFNWNQVPCNLLFKYSFSFQLKRSMSTFSLEILRVTAIRWIEQVNQFHRLYN